MTYNRFIGLKTLPELDQKESNGVPLLAFVFFPGREYVEKTACVLLSIGMRGLGKP